MYIKDYTNFTKILDPPHDSRHQKGAIKQVPYWGLTTIRCHHTKFIHHCNLAPMTSAYLCVCVCVRARVCACTHIHTYWENKCWNIIPYFSKYSNANEEHLYDAINEEFQAAKPELYTDVSIIMHTWTRQAGYPLLTVTSDGDQLTITQVPVLLTGLI